MMNRRIFPIFGLSLLVLSLALLAACAERVDDDSDGPGDAPTETATPEPEPTLTTPPTAVPDETATPDPGGEPELSWELLVTDKTLPAETFEPVIERAESGDEFERIWQSFGFDEALPEVDFDRQVVIFAGTGESGSCPLELMDISLDANEQVLTIDVSENLPPDTACTDDWTPRAWVIAVDRDALDTDGMSVRIVHEDRGPGEVIRVEFGWYRVIASEKEYPEEAIGEEIYELAESEERYQELWDWFQLPDTSPEIDFDQQVVLFAGTGESGGCPLYLHDLTFNEDQRRIEIATTLNLPPDTLCTADWTPRVNVLAIDAEQLGNGELRAVYYSVDDDEEPAPGDGVVIREE